MEVGESLTEAAVRELFEETGIQVDHDQLIGPIHRGTHTFSFDGRDYVSDSTFFALAINDVVVTFEGLEDGEVGNIFNANWWHPTDLLNDVSLSNSGLPIAQLAADAVNAMLPEDR